MSIGFAIVLALSVVASMWVGYWLGVGETEKRHK